MVNNAKRLEKKNHYNTVFSNVKGDTKGTWKKLKELIPTKSQNTCEIKRIEFESKEITDKKKIADIFNDFFVNVRHNLAEKFQKSSKDIRTPQARDQTQRFTLNLTNQHKVKQHIQKLKQGKATGLDEISVKILKSGVNELS